MWLAKGIKNVKPHQCFADDKCISIFYIPQITGHAQCEQSIERMLPLIVITEGC